MKNRLRILIAFLLLVVLAFYCVGTFKRANRPGGNDFTGYLAASKALLNGTDPYQTSTHFPYLYPPLLAFLLIPFLLVPYGVAVFIWFFVNVLALVVSGWLIRKCSEEESLDFSRLGIALLLFAAPLQSNFQNGQVNCIILLLCLCFFYFWKTSRKLLSGFFLALAIVLKVMPFVLPGFLLFRKHIKEMLYTLLFMAVLALLPTWIVHGRILEVYDSFVNTMVHYGNQPVQFLEGKKFFSLQAFFAYIHLDAFASPWFSRVLLVLVISALELFRHIRKMANRAFAWFGLYLILPLFLSPLSEIHHFVLCIPAAALSLAPDKRELPFVILFWTLYFTGHVFEEGPFYFLSLISLFVAMILRVLKRDSK